VDKEVQGLVKKALKDIISLDVTLYFHAHPELVESPEGLSHRLACEPTVLTETLQHLSEQGIVERFLLGGGRYEVFSYTHDPNRRSCVGKLSDCYHNDPAARQEIIKHIVTSSFAGPGSKSKTPSV
jgi:hypothetical protein